MYPSAFSTGKEPTCVRNFYDRSKSKQIETELQIQALVEYFGDVCDSFASIENIPSLSSTAHLI